MNIIRKAAVAAGLVAAFVLSALAATPASAYPYHHHHSRAAHMDRHANRLDRLASRAFAHGRFHRGIRLSHHAANLDRRADYRHHRYFRHHTR